MSGKELLEQQAKTKTCKAIADELGLSRATVSLVLRGKYPASPAPVYAKAEAVYGSVPCPFLCRPIPFAECDAYCNGGMPAPPDVGATPEEAEASRAALRHWRACKSCDARQGG
ncbi:hypothetical protein MYXO_04006 [Myxococcaceae bacterium]|nr:hypothetical protein MYXO_04006 [Myxococcaceae bacterium]